MDRRTLLAGMVGGGAVSLVPRGAMALGYEPDEPSTILLYNRNTGAWRTFTPNSLSDPGETKSGTSALLKGIRSAVRINGWIPNPLNTPSTQPLPSTPVPGIVTFRGSSTVTPAWEVIDFTGRAWVSRGQGKLKTPGGAPLLPLGQPVNTGPNPGGRNADSICLLGNGQLVIGALYQSGIGNWNWETLLVRSSAFQTYDPGYVAGFTSDWSIVYGMSPRFNLLLGMEPYGATATALPKGIRSNGSLSTQRGQVYGPWNGLLVVYNQTTGIGQFVQLGLTSSNGERILVTGAKIVRTAQLAVGWTHCVPFSQGWFFYHRQRRVAQIGNLRNYLVTWILQNGYIWPDGTLGDYTDAVSFNY